MEETEGVSERSSQSQRSSSGWSTDTCTSGIVGAGGGVRGEEITGGVLIGRVGLTGGICPG